MASTTVLMCAVIYSGTTSSVETVKILIDNGANVNAQTNEGVTALMYATMFSNTTLTSNIETVKLLLDHGADVNSVSQNGQSALMYACSNTNEYNIDIIKLLIENGADVNAINKNQWSSEKMCKHIFDGQF